jgi:hypothetical protein
MHKIFKLNSEYMWGDLPVKSQMEKNIHHIIRITLSSKKKIGSDNWKVYEKSTFNIFLLELINHSNN